MMLHINRSRAHTILLFRTYRLEAKLDVTPQEYAVICANNLHRFEIFHDPHRDHLIAEAEAARARVKALPWFSKTPERDALISVRESCRESACWVRVIFAFRITIGNLISGISITNRRLTEIAKVEHVLHGCIDDIKATVDAALRYQDGYEDVRAPGNEEKESPDVTPSDWPASW